MRRFVSLLLSAALLLCLLPAVSTTADAVVSAEHPAIYNGMIETVDWMAEEVIKECGADTLSGRDAIWAVYSWMQMNCERYGEYDTVYMQPTEADLDAFYTETVAKVAAGEVVADESGDQLSVAFCAWDFLTYRVGDCVAFSETLQLLLNHLGYKAECVYGTFQNLDGTVMSHMWNRVEIDGYWYWLDVRIDHAAYTRTGVVSSQYFLIADTEAWAEEHDWDTTYYPDRNAQAASETDSTAETAATVVSEPAEIMITDDDSLVAPGSSGDSDWDDSDDSSWIFSFFGYGYDEGYYENEGWWA